MPGSVGVAPRGDVPQPGVELSDLLLPDDASVKVLAEAFSDFARLTCVRFVPRSYQRDFVSIAPMTGSVGSGWPQPFTLVRGVMEQGGRLQCFSSVGRAGGMQPLSLAPACLRRGKGVALHELMHVAGFWHEHSRADRDDYISISWDHILPGFEGNFMKSRTPNMLVGYDYSSVLHYSRYAFSRSGEPTITPLRVPAAPLGQRRGLSASDAARVNRLYGCRGAVAAPAPSPRILPPPSILMAEGTPGSPVMTEGTPGSPATACHPSVSHPAPGTGEGCARGCTALGAETSG
ncbi:astacin-like metalloendopeptidase [Apteryx rowi]|uniref:astacin-like metalloendopeptidase n=1 Tax=Apteryx rowi TaxID=308060 RepID=UPI000E1C78BE|nr:astacin-like metalloendopeptidase [Apteryx rowi]